MYSFIQTLSHNMKIVKMSVILIKQIQLQTVRLLELVILGVFYVNL